MANTVELPTLTVVKELTGNLPADGGTLSPPEGVYENAYDVGEVVELSAVPDGGWRFKQWSGGASGTDPNTTIEMTGDKTVTGHFIQQHTVTTVAVNYGETSPSSTTRDHGASAQFTWEDEPFCFCQFSHWAGLPEDQFPDGPLGPGTHGSESVTVTVNDDYHFDGIAEGTIVWLTTAVDADGCTGCAVDPAGSQWYIRDNSASVNAIPGEGWGFVRWEGDVPEGMEHDNPLVLSMGDDKNVTAVFGSVTLTASVEAGACATCTSNPQYAYECADCSVTPESEDYPLREPQDSATVTATPGAGWAFDHWEGNVPGELAQNNPLQLPMNADKNVKAVFVTALLRISVEGDGTTDPAEGDHYYTPGSNATITPIPGNCGPFSHWEGDVPPEKINDNPLTVPMDQDRNVKAVFSPPEVVLDSMTFSGDVTLYWDGDGDWTDDPFESDGTAIPAETPHWAASDPTRPLCVIRGHSPGISAIVESTAAAASVVIKCEWTVDSETLTYQTTTGLSAGTQTVTLTTTDQVPNRISNDDSHASWSMSCDGGSTWSSIESGSIKTFVIYGTPYSGPVDFNDHPWCKYTSFVPTVRRIDLLCSGANGLLFKKEIAQAVAVKIHAESLLSQRFLIGLCKWL